MVFTLGVFDDFLQSGGNGIVNPIGSALQADRGWNIAHHYDPKAQLGSEGRLSGLLPSAAERTLIRAVLGHFFIATFYQIGLNYGEKIYVRRPRDFFKSLCDVHFVFFLLTSKAES